ncbi:MAG: hypothetical protein Q9217_005464 [Psora testacea]
MTGSPTKKVQHATSSQQLSSPRTTGRLRKLQSAHQLSSNYSASHGPSLISQQRQQQQQQQRNLSISHNPPVPSLPPQHSPQRHNRTRSNSDAVVPNFSKVATSPKRPTVAKKTAVPKDAKHELESLVRQGPKDTLPLALQNLRHWILCDGMDADNDGMSHVRIYVWLILLNAPATPTDSYLELTRRGPSPAHAKICNDTFRTFKTNPLFKRRVTDNSLIRLLNAVAWKLHDAKQQRISDSGRPINASDDLGSPELQHTIPLLKHINDISTTTKGSEAGGSSPGVYVQGMNVLCAPFLYVARSEAEAFVAFHRFITRECPAYVRGAMDGVHKGIALVDRCLAIVDPKLSTYLLSKGVKAEIYAFASVLTMCAGTPPLPEVLHLWDFLFAYGAHLNILCICAQLMIMREELLGSSNPGKLLRAFPPLDAKKIIMLSVGLVPRIPEHLYEELVYHAH